jgi:hypothetical protein
MANLGKISAKDKNRLQTLRGRRERLIELNLIHKFSQAGNERINKYYACLLYVRKQICFEECKNVQPLKKSVSKVFQGFLNPQNGLTLKDLRKLTTPAL